MADRNGFEEKTEWPLTLHRLLCANGETVEWSFRLQDRNRYPRNIVSCFESEGLSPEEAAYRLLLQIGKRASRDLTHY
jgi:hypothetical protein